MLVTIVAQPFWGSLADRTLKTGRILFFLCLMGGTIELFFAFNNHFVPLLLLSCLGAVFIGPVGALLDSYTFHHLGETDRGFYAHFRTWGAYGFLIICLGIGFFLEWTDLRAMYVGYAGLAYLMAIFCFSLEDIRLEERAGPKPGLGFHEAVQLLRNRPFFLLLA